MRAGVFLCFFESLWFPPFLLPRLIFISPPPMPPRHPSPAGPLPPTPFSFFALVTQNNFPLLRTLPLPLPQKGIPSPPPPPTLDYKPLQFLTFTTLPYRPSTTPLPLYLYLA